MEAAFPLRQAPLGPPSRNENEAKDAYSLLEEIATVYERIERVRSALFFRQYRDLSLGRIKPILLIAPSNWNA
jgi:hypothetical protein